MKIVCAWCGKEMGEKTPLEDKSVTHSICPKCERKHFPKKQRGKGGNDAAKRPQR